LSRRADELGSKQGNVTDSATDIENSHSRRNASLDHELSSDWIDKQGLASQSFELVL
jgi:hypothetical protein